MSKKNVMGVILPTLAALGSRGITPQRITGTVGWQHVSPQTLNQPRRDDAESRLARMDRRARRKRRMKLRLHRGRGCAG